MMKTKIHENPEFQVIKMDEANAKFYAASGGDAFSGEKGAQTSASAPVTNGYSLTSGNGWF